MTGTPGTQIKIVDTKGLIHDAQGHQRAIRECVGGELSLGFEVASATTSVTLLPGYSDEIQVVLRTTTIVFQHTNHP